MSDDLARPAGPVTTPRAGPSALRRRLTTEVWIVLGLSLGRSGVYALVNIVARLTAGPPLRNQAAARAAAAARPTV